MHWVIYRVARKGRGRGRKKEKEGAREGADENRGSAWRSMARVINLYKLEIIVGPAPEIDSA
jgi:hypothetical protein